MNKATPIMDEEQALQAHNSSVSASEASEQSRIEVSLAQGFVAGNELEGLLRERNKIMDSGYWLPGLAEYNARIQLLLKMGEPSLQEVREDLSGRYLGAMSRYLTAKNRIFLLNTDPDKSGVRLISSRVKSADRIAGKMRELETLDIATDKAAGTQRRLTYDNERSAYRYDLSDGYGIALVGQTWDVVDKQVLPYLRDVYDVVDVKRYRKDEGTQKVSGYEAVHAKVMVGDILIDVHLHDLGAFKRAEFGEAAKARHVAQYMQVHNMLKENLC